MRWIGVIGVFLYTVSTPARGIEVASTSPPLNALNQSVHSSISVTFDRPVQASTVTGPGAFGAFGRWSGPAPGTITFSNGDRTVTLTPDEPFFPGEVVFVVLANTLEGQDGSPLRAAGFSFSFWTHARRAPMDFAPIDVLDCTAFPGEHTQAYGGIASDLNNDGWSDVTIVNEVTEDLRVFLNTADGSGLMHPFLQPTFPVGDRASPSEPSDFNGDGQIDICVANIDDNTVSVLFGTGNGRFVPSQTITVGAGPRGIAVLDADGDGDMDIANTNANSSSWSILLNDGDGLFGAPMFFEAGSVEWSMAAADMNNDGITDLIIGAQSGQRMNVLLGSGDPTGFTSVSNVPCGGRTWMIAVGDVNGDGFVDVATANGTSNTAAILLNNGSGALGPADVYTVGAFCLATDLGDLDGDGALDWTTSSFSASEWRIFTNDGSGAFSVHEIVHATAAGSCTLLHDFDNDGDNDLSLIDEIADEVILYENSGKAIFADYDGDGMVDLLDFTAFDACTAADPLPPDCEVFDADADRDVDFADFAAFQIARTVPQGG